MSSTIVDGPLLIDAEQARAMLDLGRTTFGNLYRSGQIPHIRVGRVVRFYVDDLKAWIERQRVYA